MCAWVTVLLIIHEKSTGRAGNVLNAKAVIGNDAMMKGGARRKRIPSAPLFARKCDPLWHGKHVMQFQSSAPAFFSATTVRYEPNQRNKWSAQGS